MGGVREIQVLIRWPRLPHGHLKKNLKEVMGEEIMYQKEGAASAKAFTGTSLVCLRYSEQAGMARKEWGMEKNGGRLPPNWRVEG